jgi:hypothetical protein
MRVFLKLWAADHCAESQIPFALPGSFLYIKVIHGAETGNDGIDSTQSDLLNFF